MLVHIYRYNVARSVEFQSTSYCVHLKGILSQPVLLLWPVATNRTPMTIGSIRVVSNVKLTSH